MIQPPRSNHLAAQLFTVSANMCPLRSMVQVLEHYGEVTPAFKGYLFWDLLQIEKSSAL